MMVFLPEPLDSKYILSAIELKNRCFLGKLEIFDTIDSTNTYLLERVKTNIPSGSVCLANQQTQGRGRLGRDWFSPAGANIYCSLFWRFSNLQQDISGLSIAIAVMVSEVLLDYGIKQGIQLKWPNDILFSGKKLSGILLETNSPHSVVIGIGLNLYLEEEPIQNAISINDIIKPHPKRNHLVGRLINKLFEKLPLFERQGLLAFLDDWRKLDVLAGKKVIIEVEEKKIIGQMIGVSDQGELLLQNELGLVQQFRCGEVSVRESVNPT